MGETTQTRVVQDATCLACGCLCDDLRVEVADSRVVAVANACEVGRAALFAPHPGTGHPFARIDDQETFIAAALDRAAVILQNSQSPMIWGLSGTTIEAAREAVAIADAVGGTVVLDVSATKAHRLAAMQRVGKVSATRGEVRDRADVVVFWGFDPMTTHPRLWDQCVAGPGTFIPQGRAGRRVIVVDAAPTLTSNKSNNFLAVAPDRRGDLLRILRGLIRGKLLDPSRVEAATGLSFDAVRTLADALLAARYGALFVAGTVADAGEAEAVLTLVRDLNDGRRFVVMDPGSPGNTSGVGAVLTWQAGAANSVDFGRGYPRFLPGEATLAERAGQFDALLIVAESLPEGFDPRTVPTVWIGPGATANTSGVAVAIDTGRTGIEVAGTVSRSDGVMLPLCPPLAAGLPSTDQEMLQSLRENLRR